MNLSFRSCVFALLAGVLLSSCGARVSVRDPGPKKTGSKYGLTAIGETVVAWTGLRSGDSARARDKYNRAVSRVVRSLKDHFPLEGGENREIMFALGSVSASLRLAVSPEAPWDLEDIEKIGPADALGVRGFRERVVEPGAGAPVVMKLREEPERKHAAESGSWISGTAVIDFPDGRDRPVLTLYDPIQTSSVSVAGRERPLRADYTIGIATTLARRDKQKIDIPAMMRFEWYEEQHGIRQLDSIYPEKIPVVFVHGLKANPDTFRNTINEVREDPTVRSRFEFWTFSYATGSPIPFCAMQLREGLQEMVAHRESMGIPTPDVVLVGHSMGGLLSRMMTQGSGDENWFRIFKTPIDDLSVSEEERDLLRRMAYFEPLPFVHRLVLFSTPHGGSEFPEAPIGQIGSRLIDLPVQLLSLSAHLLASSFNALTPEGIEIVTSPPNSIQQLGKNSEIVKLMRDAPLNPSVKHHSIIGEFDGFVPYESTHLNGANSETLVPTDHGSHRHPKGSRELERILKEHAGLN